jgi:CheY-like chemotaxis protein
MGLADTISGGTMQTQLHILLVEDSKFDAELIEHALEELSRPFQLSRIQSEAELKHHLDRQTPDLILSDHGLPSFSGFKAPEIVRLTHPELPFIFVSGSNDQQMVVDMYDCGATDYVFKRDLHDLIPAVRRALDRSADTSLLMSVSGNPPEPKPTPAERTAAPTDNLSLVGHLAFCPDCGQTHDVAGSLVRLEEFLRSHSEVLVLRRTCAQCSQATQK